MRMKNDPHITMLSTNLQPSGPEIARLGEQIEISCKSHKKKCCKKFKNGDQCRRCPKLAVFQEAINQWYLNHGDR
jgi:hypothetical protein